MELTFIGNDGTAVHRSRVNDDVDIKELVRDLMNNGDPLVIKTCHGIRFPHQMIEAAQKSWEIEVEGVRQKTGEPTFARFTRSVKL